MHRRRTAAVVRAAIETMEARRLLSAVAPAFADKIGLTNLVAAETSFEDNFDGTSLDKTKWQVRDGYRWRAYRDAPLDTFSYTDEAALQVGGGNLQLIAHNDAQTGQLKGAFLQSGRQFNASARNAPVPAAKLIDGYSGDFEQTYGYWETRAKFNGAPGMWAAFWVHSYRMVEIRDGETKKDRPDLYGVEYDIVEHSALRNGQNTSDEYIAIVHANGYNSYRKSTGNYPNTTRYGPSFSPPSEFHTYGMLWTDTYVNYYLDGNLVHRLTDPTLISKVPQMALLSLDIGGPDTIEDGKGNNFFGNTPAGGYGSKETSQARATFDYVRVWELKDKPAPPANTPSAASGIVFLDANDDGNYQRSERGVSGLTIFADYDGDGIRDADEPQTTTGSDGRWSLSNLRPHVQVRLTLVPTGDVRALSPNEGYIQYYTYPGELSQGRDFAVGVGNTPAPRNIDVALKGTVIGTPGGLNGNTAANAYDGNFATVYDSTQANGAWAGLDLGTAAQRISQIRYIPRTGHAQRMVGGAFQASNSANFSTGVVTLATIAWPPAENKVTTVNLTNVSGYRYVRYLSPDGGYANVAEVQFYGLPGTGQTTTPPSTPASITGIVYNDANGNGVLDAGETGYVDLGVYIDSNNDGVRDVNEPFALTTTNGTYRFDNLPAGTRIVVRVMIPSGTTPTAPSGGVHTLTTTAGTVHNNLHFGLRNTPKPPSGSGLLSGLTIGTSGSFNNGGNIAARALDGNLNSYFDAPVAHGAWVGLLFPRRNVITQVQYAPRSGYAQRMVGGVFQGSNSADFSDAVTLHTITSTPAVGSLTTASISNANGFAYVRYLAPNGGWGNVAEIQFFGSASVTPQPPVDPPPTTPGGQLTGSTIGTAGSFLNGGNTAARALDGNLGTYFDAPAAHGAWAGLDLGSAKQITQVKFAPRSDYPQRMVGGIFQGSNSADFSNAVTLHTIGTAPAVGSLTTANVANTTAFRYVRYLSPNGSWGNVAEVQFFGATQALTAEALNAIATSATAKLLAYDAATANKTLYPADATSAAWRTSSATGWTSGFYPGSLWLAAAITGDADALAAARAWTTGLSGQQHATDNHDVGFQIFSTYGQAIDLAEATGDRQVLLNAAKSLSSRFSPTTGLIRSWGVGAGRHPVIIDNLMNLELLMWASKNGGESAIAGWSLEQIAVSHADRSLEHHVRDDASTYHVIEFDPATGAAFDPNTYAGFRQSYATTSTWTRGQAWAIYGYTMMFRETGLERYRDAAVRLADYFIHHLPTDGVPPADFAYGAAGVPFSADRKDATAGAIAASALLELSTLVASQADRDRFHAAASDLLTRLTSDEYLSLNAEFAALLKHGSGNAVTPNDAGYAFGDYYLLEAIHRYLDLA